ncbi:MAG: hypothetical protein M3R06_01555 [Chloroflexota bacterium]|nr:hypothetical protein [Chloroflexota bacterium]
MFERTERVPPHAEIGPRLLRGVGGLATSATAVRAFRHSHSAVVQFGLVALLGIIGLVLAAGSTLLNEHLHRGIETGAEQPYVVHSTGRELATNVDLDAFPVSEFERIAETLQSSGFRYVRQPLRWSTIEPRQGELSWERADAIVEAFIVHRLDPILVLSSSPDWARGETQGEVTDAPPADPADYAQFVGEVVRRYGDRVRFIQVWDQPNDPGHWGGSLATPAAYLGLLAPAFNAARDANSDVRVVLAEFVPTNVSNVPDQDLAFIGSLYGLGGKEYFDVVAVRLDGGDSAPTSRQVGADRLSFARAILFRDIIVAHDDAATPIWGTHFGWDASSGTEPGRINREQQADFVELGLQRSAREWPWMGLLIQWAFVPTQGGSEADYALLSETGAATPLYTRLTNLAASGNASIAASGFSPMNSAAVSYSGTWSDQHLGDQTLRTTSDSGATATLRFRGSGVVAFMRYGPESGIARIVIDGQPLADYDNVSDAAELDLSSFQTVDVPVTLTRGLDQGEHELKVSLGSEGQLTIGGLVVVRELTLMWPVVLLASGAAVCLALALREMIYAIAIRSGHLQAGREADLWPELPRLPNWRPARRA